MSTQPDVYRDWLGIKETARPLNYYQLLRLKMFDDDVSRVRSNYRKMNAHVRKFGSGDYAEESQRVLNELAKAMLCLTDVKRKGEYDASMGRKETGTSRRRGFEEILLAAKILDRDQLEKARNYADALNIDLRDAVLQQKLAPPDAIAQAFAESQGLAFVDLDDVGIDLGLVEQIPTNIARGRSCVPVMIDEGTLLMASPNPLVPDVEEQLRLLLGKPVRTVLCTNAQVAPLLAEHFAQDRPEAPASLAPLVDDEIRPMLSTEDRIRRAGGIAVVAFNIVLTLVVFARWMFMTGSTAMTVGYLGSSIGIAFPIALLVAAIAFGVVWKMA